MKVKFTVCTDKLKSEVSEIVEIDDEDFENCTQEYINERIDEIYEDWRDTRLGGGWKILN